MADGGRVMKTTCTTAEAAQLLGLNVRSVQRYIRNGQLEAERQAVGLDWYYVIDGEDLKQFAAKHGISLTTELASDQ